MKGEDGTITVDYVSIRDIIVDRLTEALTPSQIKVFINQLRLLRK